MARCSAVPAREAAGWCGTRVNQDGTLQSLIYGEVSSLSMNPIEKKPVFHFFPGSRWLSVGSLGCNFRCPGCQNWEISHWIHGKMRTAFLSPEELVRRTRAAGCLGVSWTFNEPALWFEYTLDGAKKAKEEGLFTNYVTNGSIAREALAAIAPYLDVYRVDLKGFSDRTYARMGHVGEWRGILDVARQAKAHGIHVEVVTNVIPRINDSDTEVKGIAAWIRDAISSVLLQEEIDLELVVVDDASEDETAAIVESIDDPRVRLLRNDRQRGISACHNRILDVTCTPFISHVDSDDIDTFEACASGPAVPLTSGCEDTDFDSDNDADQSDFGIVQRCISGEDNPGDPNCAD